MTVSNISSVQTDIGRQFIAGWGDNTGDNLTTSILANHMIGLQFTVPYPSLFTSLTLMLAHANDGGGGASEFNIWLCTNPNLQPFSNDNLPSDQETINVWSGAPGFVLDTPREFELDLEIAGTQTGSFIGSGAFETPRQVLSHGDFNGTIGLIARSAAGGFGHEAGGDHPPDRMQRREPAELGEGRPGELHHAGAPAAG